DEAREGRALQAQRRHAGGTPDRRHGVSRHRHPGQSRRQGEEAGHTGVGIRRSACVRTHKGRRVSAVQYSTIETHIAAYSTGLHHLNAQFGASTIAVSAIYITFCYNFSSILTK